MIEIEEGHAVEIIRLVAIAFAVIFTAAIEPLMIAVVLFVGALGFAVIGLVKLIDWLARGGRAR